MATQQDFDIVKDHTQALADNGMYVFMGAVDHESIKPPIEWILHENLVAKKKRKDVNGFISVNFTFEFFINNNCFLKFFCFFNIN